MARQPRLAVAGALHHVRLRGHGGQAICQDDADRQALLVALREAAAAEGVAVHAYAVLSDELHALASPPRAEALGRWLQGFGRRYVSAFNRRHGRHGTLWEGRFRASVVDPAWLLDAMVYIETLAVRRQLCSAAAAWPWSSALTHVGQRRDSLVTDHPAYWVSGNTPFERELAHATRLAEGVSDAQATAFEAAVQRGHAIGSPSFIVALAQHVQRPLQPRPRGRRRQMRKAV